MTFTSSMKYTARLEIRENGELLVEADIQNDTLEQVALTIDMMTQPLLKHERSTVKRALRIER